MPVARPQDKQEELLFQWPSPLTANDTLTVADGESCVSIQFGNVLGIFETGAHRLPAEIPDGVELWFCATRRIMGRKFSAPFPTGGAVFGEYAFQISAPHLTVPNMSAMGWGGHLDAYLDQAVGTALVAASGKGALYPSMLGDALGRTAAEINTDWRALGVRFLGFGKVGIALG